MLLRASGLAIAVKKRLAQLLAQFVQFTAKRVELGTGYIDWHSAAKLRRYRKDSPSALWRALAPLLPADRR